MTAAVAATVAVLIALHQLRAARAIARQKEAFNFLTKVETDRELIDSRRKFLQLAYRQGGLVATLEADDDVYTEEMEVIRVVLNEFDLLAVGVQNDIIDYDIVLQFRRSIVIDYWNRSARFVTRLREAYGTDELYGNFERLADRLSAEPTPRREPPRSWMRPGGTLRRDRRG